MRVLGISAYYHDSAAALVVDGRVVAAAQEERFTRKKHDPGFPTKAVEYCLESNSLTLDEIDYVVFYEKPLTKFERLLETYLDFAPKGFESFFKAMPLWLREKLFQKKLLVDTFRNFSSSGFPEEKILFSEHHLSHAASAFYPSPFQKALVLTMDGVGEWATTSVAIGEGSDLKIVKEIHFPNSLGLLYSAVTQYIGFKVNSGEYKVMGLAPYGEPRFAATMFEHLIDVKTDGSFCLNQKYFNYCAGLTMINPHFEKLFGEPARTPENLLTQFHMDMAASIQKVTEDVMLKLASSLAKEYGCENLCLAGGVALNCVANGKILREHFFRDVWIQPAAGDAGGAVGGALAAYHLQFKNPRIEYSSGDGMNGAYLGPKFEQKECEKRLREMGAVFRTLTDSEIIDFTAKALSEEQAVGWFQGRMEFGPRSLGNRSILGDARSPKMQRNLNLKVKYRESFRPFAPSVLREKVSEWFELDYDSPYMLLVAPVKTELRRSMSGEEQCLFGIDKLNVVRSKVPAVTHIDYSARIQTVHKDTNPKYYKLLTKFDEITGCPIVVNTSFNVRGEPIVCTPEDSFRCFMGTDLDMLVVENCILLKSEQNPELAKSYKDQFELD